MKKIIGGLHLITDTSGQHRHSHLQLAAAACAAGIRVIQYRQKDGPTRLMVEQARELVELCARHQALLIVNDRLDVALAAGAHGLHLGQDDLPLALARRYMGSKIVLGASVKNLKQLLEAKAQGADYVGFGPVFTTTSKADAGPLKGLACLADMAGQAQTVGLPLIALGGINSHNISQIKQTGADGAAVISAICQTEQPEQAARALLAAWKQ